MMDVMMKKCCDSNGMPDFEKMQSFMIECGKEKFSDDEIKMMKQFCSSGEKPDYEHIKQLMRNCGCHSSE